MNPQSASLSPTRRSSTQRGRHREVTDRAVLHEILTDALIAHLGVTAGDHPIVLPVAHALDVGGPDRDGSLYVHGSVASHWLRAAESATVCVTATELDGLVLAQSGFNHSMNYRCAVVIGMARGITDPDEKAHALNLIVDHSVPGRASTLRPSTRKELAATAVFAVSLHEASVKVRVGAPGDEPDEIVPGVWAGHLPLRRTATLPVTAPYASGPIPAEVADRARTLGAR